MSPHKMLLLRVPPKYSAYALLTTAAVQLESMSPLVRLQYNLSNVPYAMVLPKSQCSWHSQKHAYSVEAHKPTLQGVNADSMADDSDINTSKISLS